MKKLLNWLPLFLVTAVLSISMVYLDKTFSRHKSAVYVLLGPPGIGKGTQGSMISESFQVPHISTGDVLRENIKNKTPLGLTTEVLVEKGTFVPDEIVSQMIEERTNLKDCERGYILDGYPRTIEQAIHLEKHLKGRHALKVIYYTAPNHVILDRISGRLTCVLCSKTYHKTFSPPATPNTCDKCGSSISQRKDDHREVVLRRLKIYQTQTSPLINFYERKGVLHTISCEDEISNIYKQTLEVIEQ